MKEHSDVFTVETVDHKPGFRVRKATVDGQIEYIFERIKRVKWDSEVLEDLAMWLNGEARAIKGTKATPTRKRRGKRKPKAMAEVEVIEVDHDMNFDTIDDEDDDDELVEE